MLEIGSGRSTPWFAKRVKEIISFEHDLGWREFTLNELRKENLQNCNLIFDPDYPQNGVL